jgi:hypothetical protein
MLPWSWINGMWVPLLFLLSTTLYLLLLSVQEILAFMTNWNCHVKYRIGHKKCVVTKIHRHAGRHISTVAKGTAWRKTWTSSQNVQTFCDEPKPASYNVVFCDENYGHIWLVNASCKINFVSKKGFRVRFTVLFVTIDIVILYKMVTKCEFVPWLMLSFMTIRSRHV